MDIQPTGVTVEQVNKIIIVHVTINFITYPGNISYFFFFGFQIQRLDNANGIKRRLSGAPIKDTVTVPDGGFTIIRFVANNPGFWLFHCHLEFHVEVGMGMVFKVGDYDEMPNLPENFPTCSSFMPHKSQTKPPTKVPTDSSESILVNKFLLISCAIIVVQWFYILK